MDVKKRNFIHFNKWTLSSKPNQQKSHETNKNTSQEKCFGFLAGRFYPCLEYRCEWPISIFVAGIR